MLTLSLAAQAVISGSAQAQEIQATGRSEAVPATAFASDVQSIGPAGAQEEAAELGELVVTGSRIASTGFTTPTPVTTVGIEEMQSQAPSSVGDVLAQMPSFRASNNPQTAGVTSQGGRYTLNLRGLGPSRTLVLLDGHRFVPSSSGGVVDLNQIPTMLISRAEVVTGGASAAWGSDAVAGVVNLILKKDLEGLEGEVQYGVSQHGDDEKYRVSLAYGRKFADDRGSFLIGGDYVDQGGVGDQYSRDWGRREYGLITNPDYATNGLPNFIISPDVRNARTYSGSIVVSGPLQGTAFAPDGSPFDFQYGQVFGNTMIGGTGYGEATPVGSNLSGPVKRFNVLSQVDYEVSDSLRVFSELSYAWSNVRGQSGQPRDQGTLTVRRDNAFLPESVRTAMTNLNLQTLQVGRQSLDFGFNQINNQNETSRLLLGAEGRLSDSWYGQNWRWDAYFQTGFSRYSSDLYPNRINPNWLASIDAVVDPSSGSIVCRSTLTNPANGCIPTSIFGNGAAQPNAYTAGESWYLAHNSQQVYAANLQGDPLSTWAGPISVAMGAEYRRETGNAESDPLQQLVQPNGTVGVYNQANAQPFSGKYDVYEFYGETAIPLAKEQAWAYSLDLNAAIRRTVYSTSGAVTTWKVGGSYSPIEDLRFRVTRSRDIRAPNIDELFGPMQQGGITSIPNRAGVAQQVLRYGGGNTELQPEIADTFTVGAVYQPSYIRGLSLSLDYYDIEINGVIAALGHAEVAKQCFSGVQEMCPFVLEDGGGNLILVEAATLNLNALKTSGLDFEGAYTLRLEELSDALSGALRFRFLGTYVDKLVTVDGTGPRDRVGQLSNNGDAAGVPHWSWTGNVSYNTGPLTLDLQGRYVGKGLFNTQYTEGAGAANTINDNTVPAKFYVNASAQYEIWRTDEGRQLEVFGRVANLLDTDPPMIPSGGLGGTNATSTNGAFYDTIGRAFTMGVRFKY